MDYWVCEVSEYPEEYLYLFSAERMFAHAKNTFCVRIVGYTVLTNISFSRPAPRRVVELREYLNLNDNS